MQEQTRVGASRSTLALSVVLGLVAVLGVAWWLLKPPEVHHEATLYSRLQERYGPRRYSQNDEETFIRGFFEDRRDGVFLDIGANDYKHDNNTLYLEEELGWSGIAVDANSEYADGYAKHRPKTRFFTYFVADHSDDEKAFFVFGADPRISSGSKEFVLGFGLDAGQVEARKIHTITLDALLDHEKVTHVDFMSLDIEDAEPGALAGFDIKRFKPDLVCVEVHAVVRDPILKYFAENGYHRIDTLLPFDAINMYFTRRPQAEWPALLGGGK